MTEARQAPRDKVACEETVIHRGGSIQSGCGLILLSGEDYSVRAVNKALADAFGDPRTLHDILQPEDARAALENLTETGRLPASFMTLANGSMVWASMFPSDGLIGIDLTHVDRAHLASAKDSQSFADCVNRMTEAHEDCLLSPKTAVDRYFQSIAEGVQDLTGFDRVKIYRFDADLNGLVIAETRAGEHIPSFLGLKFPSGDIPKPARDLFLINKVRQVIDIDAPPEPMALTGGAQGEVVINQERSAVRYTSPVHLDYLRNMGVQSTVVMGIVVRGKLWGLIACHNCEGVRQLSPQMLSLCHVISDIASNQVSRLQDRERTEASEAIRERMARLAVDAVGIEHKADLLLRIERDLPQLLELTRSDGLAFQSDAGGWALGDVPPPADCRRLFEAARAWRDTQDQHELVTADVHRFCPTLSAAAGRFGGYAEFTSWDQSFVLKVYRRAMDRCESWAGDPDASIRYAGTDQGILHPRNSFRIFNLMAEGCSEPWEESELQICREMLMGLQGLDVMYHKARMDREIRRKNEQVEAALEAAEHRARHDMLTGLPNRRGFADYMTGLADRATPDDNAWLLHFDTDRFKAVNDTLGHLAGDMVLRHISDVLDRYREPSGYAARIGGDEFVLISPEPHSVQQIQALGQSVLDSISRPIFFHGKEIKATCTVGIVKFQPAQSTMSHVLSRSDLALYDAKDRGRGRFSIFNKDMEEAAQRRRRMEREIEAALEADAFIPYFQPQYEAATGALTGFEVLVRWQHPDRGLLLPQDFLATAEQMGLIEDIDRAMLTKSVQIREHWLNAFGIDSSISVNVSARRFSNDSLIRDLERLGPAARKINLELLETIYLDNPEVDHAGIVQDLRRTGVGIEIDDFGTGHTSLLSMLAVRPDRLKIDRRLIDPIVDRDSARELVKSILRIGDQMGIQSVAEGVETDMHRDLLVDMKCERLQGYFFGKPQSAGQLEQALTDAAA